MSNLVELLQDLRSLPSELHWFCQTFHDDSPHTSVDGGLRTDQQNRLLKDVDRRRLAVIDCLQLFGYDGDEAIPHQEYLVQALDRQLGKCDACITEYYKAKRRMVDRLRHDYHEEEVDLLVALFDKRDFTRIKRGLDNASQTLQAVDPSLRGRNALEDVLQFALVEAMSCDAFLQDEALVRNHLDKPMALVQTNRRLQVPRYVPAVTYFIFDAEPSRCNWAMQTWAKMRHGLSKDDFDFAVRDPLARQLKVLTESFPDALVLQRFWCGMRLIVEKLDKELVAHSLLALEIDVCRLSLDHLQSPTPALRFLLQTIQGLLVVAPQNFWDSMGTISPTMVIEQIFNNPQYDRYMVEAQADTDGAPSSLKDMLSWTDAFMASLQPSHQVQACRSLAFQFFDRLQGDRFAAHARLACKRAGLFVFSRTLASCNTSDAWHTQVGRMVAAESLEVASIYIQRIVAIAGLPKQDPLYEQLHKLALETIQTALALECKSVRMDYATVKQKKEPLSGFCSHTSSTMDAVVRGLDSSNPALARAALIGVNDLTGLEKFKIDAEDKFSKETQKFNAALGHLAKVVCEILERINDFRPTDLDELFGHLETAQALVASLFSPDASTYNAGLDLIKTISSEVGRREAMGHLLQSFFDTTLNSISLAIQRISRNKTYASCPRMLKTLDDTLNVLCDSQSGLLRTRTLLVTVAERKAVRHFWTSQWNALRVIYEMTEEWGRLKVSDTETLKKFCRDTMQLSDRLFDQYSCFANALTRVKQDGTEADIEETTGEHELLSQPAITMQSIVKWLRLRDPYMAKTSASLTQKVLDRMSDAKMKLDEKPVQFLEHVIKGSSQGKTHLTPPQKAEIARALERNLDRPIVLVDADQERSDSSRAASEAPQLATKRKQSQAIDFDKWTSNARLDTDPIRDGEDQNPVPLDGLRAYKMSDMANPTRASPAISNRAQQGVIRAKEASRQQAASLFKEKREKEIQAKKKRDAEMSAKAKQRSNDAAPAGVSGRKGLGVEGKDHAPDGPRLMVSSDSESDSQEEANDDLFGPPPKVSDAVRDYQLSRLKAKKHQGPVKKTRQARSAKDMRARLAPDLTGLHQTLLGWEYFYTGDFPPGTSRRDYSQVPNRFRTPLDYHQVFEPLLILEAWNGFLKSREELSIKTFDVKVANRMTVDSFIEISTTMPLSEGQVLGITEADIVLLSKGKSPTTESAEPHCLARVHRIIRKKTAMEISYRVNPGNSLMSAMAPNSTIHGARILSITPLEREYGALSGLKYFDLCDEVIQAKPSPLLQYTDQQLASLVKNYEVNGAQAKAIRSALDNDAFTLIQGPPGSGKTKTIVAIVGALLSESLKDKGVPIARPAGTQPASRSTPAATKKLLVCAPSNAAVDELVMRFRLGIRTMNGDESKVSIVRLGRSDAINTNVKDVTLEELVNAKLNLTGGHKTNPKDEVGQLMMAHKAACEELNALRSTVDEMKAQGKSATADQEHQFELLKRKRQQLSNNIDTARDNGKVAARDSEVSRRLIQQRILDDAHIICATLSGSGHDMFQNLNIEFETVIIDEAAQSIELSALIPLKYGCAKCILVGDPKQLPPTVLSREAARFQYEQSLFVRMQTNHPRDVHLLDTQYRMHPEISSFPSTAFYEGRLLDGPSMLSLRAKPWHKSEMLGPYRFFDVHGAHQSASRGHSLVNFAEIDVALGLFERLITDCRGYDFRNKIGIITPYKSQLRELKLRFGKKYGTTILETVEFNTTDAFQGRESEVIIFSCVRASISKGIGFLDDIRRMNVGITRAKCSLWVLGNSQSLMKGEFWAKLIQDAKSRDRFLGGDLLSALDKPIQELTAMTNTPLMPRIWERESCDVEMTDAPVSGTLKPNDSQATGPSGPAGGRNGLNVLANCEKCGSAAHMTHRCDNVAAMPHGVCQRCGEADHVKENCTTERCLQCGEFGHVQKLCLEKGVSGFAKDIIRKEVDRQQKYVQRAPKVKAQKQLGDHDKNVPVVRTTAMTPPSVTQVAGNRKRDDSPPMGQSRNPMNSALSRNGIQQANGRTGPNASATSIPRTLAGNIPGRPAATTSRLEQSHHARPSRTDAISSAASLAPEPIPASDKELGVNRHPLPPHRVPPGLKKRKEADPFIRPKDKRPKR